MSKKDNVDKIKSYIDDILGTKISLRKKLPSKKTPTDLYKYWGNKPFGRKL